MVSKVRIRPQHPIWGSKIETEGFGIMAQDMGHQCWGLSALVVHAPELQSGLFDPVNST
jgi:hypothetical protein